MAHPIEKLLRTTIWAASSLLQEMLLANCPAGTTEVVVMPSPWSMSGLDTNVWGCLLPLQLSLTHRVTAVQGGTSSRDHGTLSASPTALLPSHVLWERLMATDFHAGVAPWQPTHCVGGL